MGKRLLLSTFATQANPRRQGVSLLELLAVVVLIGIFSTAIMTRMSRDILGDSGARSEARRISIGLLGSQRAAIRTGETYGITFAGSLTQVSSWTSMRIDSTGNRQTVDGPNSVPNDIRLSVDQNEVWFDFEGNGTALNANIEGPHRTWSLSVAPLTSMIDCQESGS